MQLRERRCEVCGGEAAPGSASAHLARVIWLCAHDSRRFHASAHFALARRANSTSEAWRLADEWVLRARALPLPPAALLGGVTPPSVSDGGPPTLSFAPASGDLR